MRSVRWTGVVVALAMVGLALAGTTTPPTYRGPQSLTAAPQNRMPVSPPPALHKVKAPKTRKPGAPLKGAPEPEGHSTILSTGGPDGYGYGWIDSNEPGWTPPAYLDPPAGITSLGDDDYVEVPLPFSFAFYGVAYNSIFIGSNGFASFGSGYTTYSNGTIPSTSTPNNALYVFWDDMRPPSGGHIDTATYTIGGQKVFVIEWDSIPHYSNIGTYTFEIQLYEAGDSMAFLYNSVVGYSTDYDSAASATIGIENDNGTDGLQYSYNTKSVGDGDVILFYRLPISDDVGVLSIDVPAGAVNLGSTITPTATVVNMGTNAASFNVTYEILDATNSVVYSSTRSILALSPGDQAQQTFDNWTPATAGTYTARVYTVYSADQVPSNDTLEQPFDVSRLGTDYLVIDLDPEPSSGHFIHTVLQNLGYAGYYSTDPTALTAANMDSFATVWITLGIYSDNYSLSRTEVQELQTYLMNGGRAYVEGGDCWGYDDSYTLLDSLFGIDPANTDDGSDDLDTIMGLSNPFIPEITEQDTWYYGGPNNYIDRLAVSSVPPFGGIAAPVLYNPIEGYNTGVAYSNSTYNTFAMSHEISGDTVGATRATRTAADLVEWIMNFLSGPTLQIHDLSLTAVLQPECPTLLPTTYYPVQVVVKNTGTYTETNFSVRVLVTDTSGAITYYDHNQAYATTLNPGEMDTVTLSDWYTPVNPVDMVMTASVYNSGDQIPENDTLQRLYFNYHRHGTYACNTFGPFNLSDVYFLADMAYDPTRQVMYVVDVDGSDHGILVLDADSSSPTYGDSIGYIPDPGWNTSERGIAYDPVNDNILVGGWNDDAIHVVDAGSHTLISTWNVGLSISGLAWDDDQNLLWIITNSYPDKLYLADPYGQTLLDTLTVAWGGFSDGYSGAGLAYLGSGQLLAANQSAYTLEVLRGCTGASVLANPLVGPFTGGWGVGYIDGTDIAWITDAFGDYQQPAHIYEVWAVPPVVPGDVNGDGQITPADLAALTNYLYHGGAAPAGNPDANEDSVVDAQDLKVISDYLFYQGPTPGCP